MITADLLRGILNPNTPDPGRDWQNVSCPYCLDNTHLSVEAQWLIDGRIPHDVLAGAYYMPVRRCDLIYIPCDCKLDLRANTEQKQPRTFREYFGEPIRSHWYGRRLMDYRNSLSAKLAAGHRPGSDGHMHVSEAWECLGADVADPPESELVFENYVSAEVPF